MTKPALAFLVGSAFFGCAHQPVEPSSATPAPNTAAALFGEITDLAQAQNANVRLMNINSPNVRPDGTSDEWRYRFRDASSRADYWLHAASQTAVYDSTANRITEGDAFITHSWCNSDVAMAAAELNGGTQFRAANPRSTITISLGEAVVADPTTWWWIQYQSIDDGQKHFGIRINATTKVVEKMW